MKISEKIYQIINVNGLTKNAFAKKLGISSTIIYHILEDRNKPSADVLQKISSMFGISLDWLLMDKGEMLIKKDNNIVSEQAIVYQRGKKQSDQDIPLYDIEAAAGLVQLFQKHNNIIDYITIPNIPKCDGALRITGDSMYPLLKSGDIVMYKQEQDIPNGIFWGEMYLLSIANDGDDMILVKYIQKSEQGKDFIKLVSYNEHHQPKDIPVKNIRALALVKASIRINTMS